MTKILIVEDNIALAKFYSRVLDKTGASITETYSIETALAYLHHEVPDLILQDMSLPDGTGQTVIDYIRSRPALINTRIVVISSDSYSKSHNIFKMVDKVITKPVSSLGLLDVVKQFGLTSIMI
jgi:CheY-like chemotaxis protein